MQFLPDRNARLAVLTALAFLATPALAQSDLEKKSGPGTQSQKGRSQAANGAPEKGKGEKGDRITRPRSPDVTGSPVAGTNSTGPNTAPASSGPGVNPNVEDKNPGSATGSERGTPPRMSDQGRANTNRQALPDSDKGKTRAEARKDRKDSKESKDGKSSEGRRARLNAPRDPAPDLPRP